MKVFDMTSSFNVGDCVIIGHKHVKGFQRDYLHIFHPSTLNTIDVNAKGAICIVMAHDGIFRAGLDMVKVITIVDGRLYVALIESALCTSLSDT